MQPCESPFPCHWWGIGLEDAGLDDVRPDVGTYGQYEFKQLPALPFEMRGDFAWLYAAPEPDQHNLWSRLLCVRASGRPPTATWTFVLKLFSLLSAADI
ncbi:MAG: hypothetical protein L0220_19175 [Acidobacteria bacterium]|nr:hypothetical protein [Acidobacteriota bacterium]